MTRDGTVHPLASAFPDLQTPAEWCSGCGLGIVLQSLLRAVQECALAYPKSLGLVLSEMGCLGLLSRADKFPGQVVPPGELLSQAFSLANRNPKRKIILLASEADVLVGGWAAVLPGRPGLGRRRSQSLQEMKSVGHEADRQLRNPLGGDSLGEEESWAESGPQVNVAQLQGHVVTLYINSGLLSLFNHPRRQIPWPGEGEKEIVQVANLPAEASRRGAVSASRWTPLHVRRLTLALKQTLQGRPGFHFLEIMSPCLLIWADKEKLGAVVERMEWLKTSCEILPQASATEMTLEPGSKIAVGFLQKD
ncbi:MAG: hypothetical protein J7L26_00495 [Candidatus Aminicenantes bacterium]|nr:hypothetical protein [Candidatus Aminicenantes bacterium]